MTQTLVPTKGGQASEGDVFAQLIETNRVAEELSYFLAHMQNDEVKRLSYLKMGEMYKQTSVLLTKIATGKIRSQVGYR